MWQNKTHVIITTIVILGALGLVGQYLFSSGKPMEITFTIEEGSDRRDVARAIGTELRWEGHEEEAFASVYAQMHWAAFNTLTDDILGERFDWSATEREVFLTNSTQYFQPSFDLLGTVHVPGTYTLPGNLTMAGLAGALIERQEALGDELEVFIESHLDEEAVMNTQAFITEEIELLPDLVPLPPQDMTLTQNGARTLLSFSTSYYNQGEGPLELRADEATAGIASDIERDVFQRIYHTDDTYHDRHAGTFLWHQPHLHYHFADFVVYNLEAVDVPEGTTTLDGVQAKSTFCIRDVSWIEVELVERPEDAAYRICGKERQGISVGWADTYFYTYPDQNLDLSGLPSGTYRLSFIVNPEERFAEITRENNTSSALFALDVENRTIEVLETVPEDIPTIEHIYYEQDL